MTQDAPRTGVLRPTAEPAVLDGAGLDFQRAMAAYKARSGRMFPTWTEVLEVLRDLGYRKSGMANEEM